MSECSSKKQVSSLEAGSHSRDCVIRTADGGEFRAPRSFLSALSPVFQVVFSVDYGGRRDVLLTDVSAPTMTALLRYYTSHTLRLNEDNVTEVLVAADMLLMDEARNCCLNYMLRNLKIENCLGKAALAQWFYCPDFKRMVLSYAREHFDQVWRTSDEFPGISEALLIELLTSNELRVRTETDVLHSIVRWYSRNASPVKAGADLFRLLESVRVGLCQSLEPTDCCRSSPTLAGIDAYNAAVLEAQQRAPCLFSPCARLLLQYAARCCLPAHVATPSDEGRGDGNNADVTAAGAPARPGPLTQVPCGSCGVARNLERWLPRMPYQMLFVVGGYNGCGERDTVETYDPRAGRWLMNRMQGFNPRAYHGIALLQNRLYVVGGVRENSFLRSCDCFDLESCTWQSCSTMKIARGYVSVVALEDYVYAIGGCNAGGFTASVERYSPSSNQWTLVRAMTRERSNGGACAFKGRIYVSGGLNGQKVLASVEVYTPSQNTWCVAKRLPSPRCCHQMVVFGGRIYVIGGYNGRRRLQSVLCSGDGEEPLTWHQMNPIRRCRSSFGTAIFNGNLYIIGGYDGTNIIAEVERYCPNSDSWREVAPLNEACFAIAACSVKSLNVCKHFSTNAER